MKKALILLSLLFVSTNMFSQITIKIKELSIAHDVTDEISDDLVMMFAYSRIKLKVELNNGVPDTLRFRGGIMLSDKFYANFNYNETAYSRIRCIVKSTNIPYHESEMELGTNPYMYYIDLAQNESFDVTMFIAFGFSEH